MRHWSALVAAFAILGAITAAGRLSSCDGQSTARQRLERRYLAQAAACATRQCPPSSDAIATCAALGTSQQQSIRNNLIAHCSTLILNGLPSSAASCCAALPTPSSSDWSSTLACMW